MPIKVGGKVYDPTHREDREPEMISADAFQAYDEASQMDYWRGQAIDLWFEVKKLEAEIDDQSPSHPKYAGAVKHLDTLRGELVNACVSYLQAERRADLCWKALNEEQRERERLDAWFSVSPDRESLYGVWFSPLLDRRVPPADFYPDEIALMVAIPEQQRVYHRLRYGRDKLEWGEGDG